MRLKSVENEDKPLNLTLEKTINIGDDSFQSRVAAEN